MKKMIFSLLAFLAFSAGVNAQSLSVSDVYAKPGTTASYPLVVNVGEGAYTGFQYDIHFSGTGFSTPETNFSTVNADWTGGSITPGSLSGGTGRVSALSMSNVLIPSGDILIGTVAFNVGSDVEFGEYTVTISNFEFLSGTERKPVDDVTFKVKVVDVLVLDENSYVAPTETEGSVEVRVLRTIKANEWSTLCLPFDIGADKFRDIFGNDVQLACFSGYDTEKTGADVTSIKMNFEDIDLTEDDFYGNTPYLIKTSKDITEFTVTATIGPDDVYDYYRKSGKIIWQVYGTYQAGTVVPEDCLFISGNKFWYSAGKTKMKAFRVYFELKDVLADTADAGARITMSFDDETTGIREQRHDGDDRYYDLKGMRVEKPSKKGVYINNGKTKVVK